MRALVIAAALAAAAPAAAGPIDAPGFTKAFSCSACHGRAGATRAACHGEDGRGDAAKGTPDLTGQPPGYLLNQMKLFKAEKRSPGDATLTSIKVFMKSLDDATLADLAAYYSSLGR